VPNAAVPELSTVHSTLPAPYGGGPGPTTNVCEALGNPSLEKNHVDVEGVTVTVSARAAVLAASAATAIKPVIAL
jgi:hypothetical protein